MIDEIERHYTECLGGFVANHIDDESLPTRAAQDNWLIKEILAIAYEWSNGRPLCQSPIEERLLATLITTEDGYDRISFHETYDVHPPKFSTVLVPQARVLAYRLDFLLIHFVDHKPSFRVAIECDGHDFHERTKEQARRDKSRDRDLAADDITVLRFTGSEIYRDAPACCEEVTSLLAKKIDAFLSQKFRR